MLSAITKWQWSFSQYCKSILFKNWIFFADDDNQKLENDYDIKRNVKSDTAKQQEEEQNKMTCLELAFAWECFEKAQEMRWSEFKVSWVS